MKKTAFSLFVCLGLLSGSMAPASEPNKGVVSAAALDHSGLDRAWMTHVQADGVKARVVSAAQHIHSTKTITRYDVVYGTKRVSYSETGISPFGKPFGVKGAKAAADLKVEILAAEGITAEVQEIIRPEITFYFLTDQFVVHAIDGESGATKWATQVGKRDNPTSRLAVNDDMVCLVNGIKVYGLSTATGAISWERSAHHAPGAGAVLSPHFAFVQMVDGSIEAFPVGTKSPTEQLTYFGRSLTEPTITNNSLIWVNNQGVLFVAAHGTKLGTISYRLHLGAKPAAGVTSFSDNRMVVPLTNGDVMCFAEDSGSTVWKLGLGERAAEDVTVIGGDAYLTSVSSTLFSISSETGKQNWEVSHVKKFLGASATKAYYLDRTGDIIVLDRKTGVKINRVPCEGVDFAVTNNLTDRLIVGSTNGLIQCIREVDAVAPTLHVAMDLKSTPEESTATPVEVSPTKPATPKPMDEAEPMDSANPFGKPAGK